MGIQRGIIQSRGIGDILIALPIARHYFEQGDAIVWPICEEFLDVFKDHAPWVNWVGIPTDPQGRYFLETPLSIFKEWGVDANEALYLYQYLSSNPELTDPEMFNILKFDQYKYATAGVPFVKKWRLGACISRNSGRELALKDRLALPKRYCVVHLNGSNARVDVSLVKNFIDPAVHIVDVDTVKTGSIFDWLAVIEEAESVVCIDSCFANMIDQLGIDRPNLFWIRRSAWDLTPVLGSSWTIVPTNLPITEPKRVDPLAAQQAQQQQLAQEAARTSQQGGLMSHVPFETNKTGFPTNFMHALK
jgi:hypothetical protein